MYVFCIQQQKFMYKQTTQNKKPIVKLNKQLIFKTKRNIHYFSIANNLQHSSSKNTMKKHSSKSPQLQQSQQEQHAQLPDHHNLLEYYKSKIDQLCKQRSKWLMKFDQCRSKLQQKHSLKQQLLKTRNEQRQLNRNIVHHEIALIDQKLNVIRVDRQNLLNDYRDAEEVVKINDVMQSYPQEIESMFPCYAVNGGSDREMVRNQLNIHNSKDKKVSATRLSKKSPPNNFNIKHSLSQKSQQRNPLVQYTNIPSGLNKPLHAQGKITPEQLLQRQIIELQQNHQQQLQTMHQLKCKLQELIRKTKQQEKQKLNKQREIVNRINQQHKQLEKKHKSLADQYFTGRREQKQHAENLIREKQELLNKNKVLEEKVNKQLKIYEKENKAKQLLILKKSEDFQENYRAKMRAKERNLQALKQNYEKMQHICIQKVTKLQTAVNKAKNKLKQAQERKQFLVDELRQQLHTLQKQVQEQKLQREQRELKLRLRAEKEKLRQQEEKEKKERQQAKLERNRFIEESYKRTVKAKQNKSTSKDHRHSKSRKSSSKVLPGRSKIPPKRDLIGRAGQQSQQDESLEMDDLENIRRQIGELETKIAADTK